MNIFVKLATIYTVMILCIFVVKRCSYEEGLEDGIKQSALIIKCHTAFNGANK